MREGYQQLSLSRTLRRLLAPGCLVAWPQDIGDRYPEWLEANKDKLSAGEAAAGSAVAA